MFFLASQMVYHKIENVIRDIEIWVDERKKRIGLLSSTFRADESNERAEKKLCSRADKQTPNNRNDWTTATKNDRQRALFSRIPQHTQTPIFKCRVSYLVAFFAAVYLSLLTSFRGQPIEINLNAVLSLLVFEHKAKRSDNARNTERHRREKSTNLWARIQHFIIAHREVLFSWSQSVYHINCCCVWISIKVLKSTKCGVTWNPWKRVARHTHTHTQNSRSRKKAAAFSTKTTTTNTYR